MTPRYITALALTCAISATALKAEDTGFYLRLDNGVSSLSGANAKIKGVGEAKAKFDPGYVIGGAIGYDFNPIALELQYDYTNNELSDLSGVELKQNTFLANAIYSVKFDEVWSAKLGAGLGFQSQNNTLPSGTVTNYSLYGFTVNGAGSNKSDTAFAAQLKSSVSAKLAQNLSLEAGYSLRYVGESDVYTAGGSVSNGAVTVAGTGTLNLTSHWAHLFTVGLSYKF